MMLREYKIGPPPSQNRNHQRFSDLQNLIHKKQLPLIKKQNLLTSNQKYSKMKNRLRKLGLGPNELGTDSPNFKEQPLSLRYAPKNHQGNLGRGYLKGSTQINRNGRVFLRAKLSKPEPDLLMSEMVSYLSQRTRRNENSPTIARLHSLSQECTDIRSYKQNSQLLESDMYRNKTFNQKTFKKHSLLDSKRITSLFQDNQSTKSQPKKQNNLNMKRKPVPRARKRFGVPKVVRLPFRSKMQSSTNKNKNMKHRPEKSDHFKMEDRPRLQTPCFSNRVRSESHGIQDKSKNSSPPSFLRKGLKSRSISLRNSQSIRRSTSINFNGEIGNQKKQDSFGFDNINQHSPSSSSDHESQDMRFTFFPKKGLTSKGSSWKNKPFSTHSNNNESIPLSMINSPTQSPLHQKEQSTDQALRESDICLSKNRQRVVERYEDQREQLQRYKSYYNSLITQLFQSIERVEKGQKVQYQTDSE